MYRIKDNKIQIKFNKNNNNNFLIWVNLLWVKDSLFILIAMALKTTNLKLYSQTYQ